MTFDQPDSFVSIARHLSAANASGRPFTAVVMSTATWLALHDDVGKTPGNPRADAGRILGVPISIDDAIEGVRYVA